MPYHAYRYQDQGHDDQCHKLATKTTYAAIDLMVSATDSNAAQAN